MCPASFGAVRRTSGPDGFRASSPHSMTSSARTRIGGGTAAPQFRKRQSDQSSSKSLRRPGPRSVIGCRKSNSEMGATCLRAVSEPNRTSWVEKAGLDTSSAYGTHSMRRTKAAEIYKRTGNLRAVQLLLWHMKLESTVPYLGIEVDDALSISVQVEL